MRNQVERYEDYFRMTLNNRQKEIVAIFKIDEIDLIKVQRHKWCYMQAKGYAVNASVGYLHHYLMGKKEGYAIQHINGNKHDNRRDNLRYVARRKGAHHE